MVTASFTVTMDNLAADKRPSVYLLTECCLLAGAVGRRALSDTSSLGQPLFTGTQAQPEVAATPLQTTGTLAQPHFAAALPQVTVSQSQRSLATPCHRSSASSPSPSYPPSSQRSPAFSPSQQTLKARPAAFSPSPPAVRLTSTKRFSPLLGRTALSQPGHLPASPHPWEAQLPAPTGQHCPHQSHR